ncbi:hypothetical protein CSOJ01_07458 [Colletotrichum sojae]|uniref:Uncharacterized protein n=1 Tax=Colletotrichum sojae TaxID=2175907 RepID=A0A8H6J957_9PEZI|nr:hypothetical protein CSOJ01_07458 [Colletotrichum sojae]
MADRKRSGDVFASLPIEIRKAILNNVERQDALNICSHSAAMYRASLPLAKQLLESELGADVISQVFPDAHAFTTFLNLAQLATDDEKKAAVKLHLTKWHNGDLVSKMSELDKIEAAHYLERIVVPFARDFAHKNADIFTGHLQLRFPDWSHPSRGQANGSTSRYDTLVPASPLTDFYPSERVRLLRAFCRFDIMSKVIKARPGAQLYSMAEQKDLLSDFFDAWEMEEITCVQKYVLDLHLLLVREYMAEIPRFVAGWAARADRIRGAGTVEEARDSITQAYAILRGDFPLHQEAGVAPGQSPFHVDFKMRNCLGVEAPIRKFPFLDVQTQSTFVKQIATFGLDHLHELLGCSPWRYVYWLRDNQDKLLANMATPEQAQYFGMDPNRLWVEPDEEFAVHLHGTVVQDNGSDDGNDSADEPVVYLGLNPGKREEQSNLGWRLLKNASAKSIEGFRRCGWVFWDEARLRQQHFWKRDDHEYIRPGSRLAWVMHPFVRGSYGITDPPAEDQIDDHSLTADDMDEVYASVDNINVPGLAGDSLTIPQHILTYLMQLDLQPPLDAMPQLTRAGPSAADEKLSNYHDENKDRYGDRWGLRNPIHPLLKVAGWQFNRRDWDNFMGPIGLDTPLNL